MKVRTIAGWGCAGLALLAEAALAWGDHETRSGGRAVVADTLGRADWLGGVVLLGALAAGLLLGNRLVRKLAKAGLVLLTAGSVLLGALVLVLIGAESVDHPERKTRTAAPGGADRVLTVIRHRTNTTETEMQVWDVQVEDGSGWSGRRWTLLTVHGKFEGEGAFTEAHWNGPDRVTVSTDLESRTYDFSGGAPVLSAP
ncbi:hypothetical protein ACFC6L_29100 [Kitasatospora phosalacinea]|uniref:hypothetical protein n=1 Tax=Kitasatospora phosalacinea TaxID=2065 RepID=UPI0035E3046A